MLLEMGGESQFQIRPIEGVTLANSALPERLILDGQQRLTSLTQVLKVQGPVATKDDKDRSVKRFYYIDIERALGEGASLEDAIIGLDESLTSRTNFGRDIVRDLSAEGKEYDPSASRVAKFSIRTPGNLACTNATPTNSPDTCSSAANC